MKIRAIRYQDECEEKVKKIVNRSNSRPTGKYPSWKMGRMMQWETVGHLEAFRLLDADSQIRAYQERPMEIEYEVKGLIRVERPDLLVLNGIQKELWSIKKVAEISGSNHGSEVAKLTVALAGYGFLKKVVIVESLRQEPRRANLITLLGLGRNCWVSPIERERVRLLFSKRGGSIKWGDISSSGIEPFWKSIVCRLVLEGAIHFDLTTPWERSTPFHWHGGRLNNVKESI